ncbi:serpin family protein [Pontiellaceae bacterium B12227]|nr:serpin family protein [Pontiellaceae bacterium B12227]
MKNLLLGICVALCVISCGAVEQPPADQILKMVQTKLPSDPIKLVGSLKVRTRNGFTKSNLPVEMKLNWGADPATAFYQIDKEALTITWQNGEPTYDFSNPRNTPTSEILGTGLTWADLSFSMLWWPDSKLVGEEKKINREAYVVDIPMPGSENIMRLWIEKYMGMVLEAQTLDKKEKQLRRMKIKSIKKMDGMWVAKDLEVLDKKTGNKATLQISDLEWMPKKPTAAAFDAAASINQLTVDLYRQTAEQKGNLFLSPFSISTALAMVYGGARGETDQQMNTTLHYGGQGATHPSFSHLRKSLNAIQKKGQVQLNVANSLWPQVDYAFLSDYLGLTKEFYGVEIEPVDFKRETEAARLRINNWVEAKTNDKIKDLLEQGSLTTDTRLVLANAIYFKGNWASQFKKEATHNAPFTLPAGTEVQVPMMVQTDDVNIAWAENFQALELPYAGDDLSMIVLLPNDKNGMADLEKTLSAAMLEGLQFNKQEVMVQLPKFKFEWKFELSKTLKAMGMPIAFSNQADFSGMDGSKGLALDFVIHQAFVEVNEEGTAAAAATAVGIRATSMPPQFTADHPFLFLIRDNSTGTILFIGRVADPSA